MEALRDAMGPIDTGAFGVFRERAAPRRRAACGGEGAKEKKRRRMTKEKKTRLSGRRERGSTGVRRGRRVRRSERGTPRTPRRLEACGDANTANERGTTRPSERFSAIRRRRRCARRRGSRPSAETERGGFDRRRRSRHRKRKAIRRWKRTTRRDRPPPPPRSCRGSRLLLEISGAENRELAAQTAARLALLSPDDKSDDVVAAELFDFLGDAGVELIMGAIERRGAMAAEALRGRVATAAARRGGKREAGPRARAPLGAADRRLTTTRAARRSSLDGSKDRFEAREASTPADDEAEGRAPARRDPDDARLPPPLCEGDWERAEETEKKNGAVAKPSGNVAAAAALRARLAGKKPPSEQEDFATGHDPHDAQRVRGGVPAALAARAERERPCPSPSSTTARPAFAGVSHLNRIQSRYTRRRTEVENLAGARRRARAKPTSR